MRAAIELEALSKRYGDTVAVDDVSLSVAPGQIFAYLGRNGSGKTTTVRMLTTLSRPTGGTARIHGHDIVTAADEVRSRIGVTMQEAALDPQMTALEHLRFIAGLLGHDRERAEARGLEMLELFGLRDVATKAIGTFSGGMQRRLDIATALLDDPPVLFLDEPTTGLDPQSRRATWREIDRLRTTGVTIFLTTQYLEEADALADHLAIIDGGRVIARGTPASLKAAHGRKLVSFALATEAGTDAATVANLAAIPGVEVAASNGRVQLEAATDVAEGTLLQAISTATDGGQGLRDIEITATSLEDVFLRLTGAAINESSAPPADAP